MIVCEDGVRTTTIAPAGFETLMSDFDITWQLEEVHGSSLFREILA